MKRVVSLYLPSWPTDRLRREMGNSAPPADEPLVTVGRDGNRRVVLAADNAARQLGISPGTPATKANALVAGLHIHDARPSDDDAALERLAWWALRLYSPAVAVDDDGLFIDASGAAHLFGGELAMLADMVKRLQAGGVVARAAMAGTYGTAHALARFVANPTATIANDQTSNAVRDLPIRSLRLAPTITDGLRTLGFDRIGDVDAQPRAPFALRFGPELGRRLDQAYGRVGEPMELVTAPEAVIAKRAFAEPIGAPETLERHVGLLVRQLAAQLEDRSLGARCLDLLFLRVDNRVEAIRIGTSKPCGDAKMLTKLLVGKLESVDPGFGVETMTLVATTVEPQPYRQAASALGERPKADVSGLVDALANRIGQAKLYRAVPIESDVPERSVGRIAPLAATIPTTWPAHWPRPARLLPRPEPIETVALLPDQPPVTFTWRGLRRKVRRADGPERIFGEWWKRDAELEAVRDYFQIEAEDGERFWVFRAGDGEQMATGDQRWFLHGLFG